MAKYDVSGLFYKKFETDRFINALNVGDIREASMRSARTKVRNKLKSAFTEAKSNIGYLSRLNEDQRTAFQNIEPRFWPQGSFAYGTQNMPAKTPPQQIDIDDGVYLPIEAFRDKPIVLKEIFFEIVDAALKNLAEEEGWEFKDNDNCARVELDFETHLDVPLYVIPVSRFDDLQKAMGRIAINEAYLSDQYLDTFKRYLSEEEVYLAIRPSPHWIKSDPIRIQEWFEREQALYGSRLTRVCRYFKAWRDATWEKGGPSSIALMICIWHVFNDRRIPFYSDSEAVYYVCKNLPGLLRSKVYNPVSNHEEIIFPRGISASEHQDIVSLTEVFCDEITKSLSDGVSSLEVVETFIRHWGERLPKRPDWVISASVAAAGIVKSTKAAPQPKPNVTGMRSGNRSA